MGAHFMGVLCSSLSLSVIEARLGWLLGLHAALLPGNRNQGQIAGGVPGVFDGAAVVPRYVREAIQAVVGVSGAAVRGEAGTDQGEQVAGGGLRVAGRIGGGDAEDRGASGRDVGGQRA